MTNIASSNQVLRSPLSELDNNAMKKTKVKDTENQEQNIESSQNELHTKLEEAAKSMANAADKMNLAIAKIGNTSRFWTLRRCVKLGTIGAIGATVVVLNREFFLQQVGNIPSYFQTAYYLGEQTPLLVLKTVEAVGKMVGNALVITSRGLDLLRKAAGKMGITHINPPPSSSAEQLADGGSWLACVSSCSFVLGTSAKVLPPGMVSAIGSLLPSSVCLATCTAEAVRSGSAGEILTGAKDAVGGLVQEYGPQVAAAAKEAATAVSSAVREYGPPVVAAAKEAATAVSSAVQEYGPPVAAAAGNAAGEIGTQMQKAGPPLLAATKTELQRVWNITKVGGRFIGTRVAPPAITIARTGLRLAANVTAEHSTAVVRVGMGVGLGIFLRKVAVHILGGRNAAPVPNGPEVQAQARLAPHRIPLAGAGEEARAIGVRAEGARVAADALEQVVGVQGLPPDVQDEVGRRAVVARGEAGALAQEAQALQQAAERPLIGQVVEGGGIVLGLRERVWKILGIVGGAVGMGVAKVGKVAGRNLLGFARFAVGLPPQRHGR